jgi:hypothetical protein
MTGEPLPASAGLPSWAAGMADLGRAHHPPPSVAVPPWLYRLEARVGPVTAAAIMTTQTNGLLLP